MWSNVISIDKEFEKETDFILERLKSVKDLSYAVEESKDRIWIYLACICDLQDKVEKKINSIVETVFLSFLKLRFFLTQLSGINMNHANCMLICSLVHFDRDYESNIIMKVLSETADYNIDGMMNFRLRALLDNWDELISVAIRLIDASGEENDIFDIASFITGTEGGKCQLSLNENKLYNITDKKIVDIVNLFDKDDYNLISAIVREHPTEIVVEKTELSPPMSNTLRHIARVITK